MWLLVDKGSHGNIEARTLLRFAPRHASTQPRQRGMSRHEQELSGSSFNSSPGCSRDRADTAAIVGVTADPGKGEEGRWWWWKEQIQLWPPLTHPFFTPPAWSGRIIAVTVTGGGRRSRPRRSCSGRREERAARTRDAARE